MTTRNASIQVEDTRIGEGYPPYVIAEAGSNFNQDLTTALKLIDAAADAGSNAVKFQLFSAEALYPKQDPLYQIFKSVELCPDWVPQLQQHARSVGLAFTASVFDESSLKVLEAVGVSAHKVASSETTNIRLLQKIARTRKPVIISTGMCDLADVTNAVEVCESAGNGDYALLQCSSEYPLPPELANLRVIPALRSAYGCPVGLSDHTLGAAVSLAAIGLDACIFEKHFTLDRSHPGPDHFYALEPDELKRYVQDLHNAYLALGGGVKQMTRKERELGRREGLYAARRLGKGEAISPDDLVFRRPALGIRERFARAVVGMRCVRDVEKDAPIGWADIE